MCWERCKIHVMHLFFDTSLCMFSTSFLFSPCCLSQSHIWLLLFRIHFSISIVLNYSWTKKINQNNVAACVIEESKQQLQQNFWKRQRKQNSLRQKMYGNMSMTRNWQEVLKKKHTFQAVQTKFKLPHYMLSRSNNT